MQGSFVVLDIDTPLVIGAALLIALYCLWWRMRYDDARIKFAQLQPPDRFLYWPGSEVDGSLRIPRLPREQLRWPPEAFGASRTSAEALAQHNTSDQLALSYQPKGEASATSELGDLSESLLGAPIAKPPAIHLKGPLGEWSEEALEHWLRWLEACVTLQAGPWHGNCDRYESDRPQPDPDTLPSLVACYRKSNELAGEKANAGSGKRLADLLSRNQPGSEMLPATYPFGAPRSVAAERRVAKAIQEAILRVDQFERYFEHRVEEVAAACRRDVHLTLAQFREFDQQKIMGLTESFPSHLVEMKARLELQRLDVLSSGPRNLWRLLFPSVQDLLRMILVQWFEAAIDRLEKERMQFDSIKDRAPETLLQALCRFCMVYEWDSAPLNADLHALEQYFRHTGMAGLGLKKEVRDHSATEQADIMRKRGEMLTMVYCDLVECIRTWNHLTAERLMEAGAPMLPNFSAVAGSHREEPGAANA